MRNVDDITKTVNRYLEVVAQGRVDDIVELYADDAVIEDPVGSERHIGREAIRGFYSAIEGVGGTAELITLRVCSNEAAFHARWTMTGLGVRVEPIDVMTFDDAGKITSMKAYWSPEDTTQLS